MKLTDLTYFKTLAESKSFTETAEAFYISQPSISISLKRLEEAFGTTLITRDRSSKSVELTEAGKLLYKSALDILEKIDHTHQAIDNLESKEVFFGFLPTIGGHFLPKLLPHLSDFRSILQLVEEESSDTMYELVRDRKVPAAIVGSDKPTFKDTRLTQLLIAERDLSLWVSPSHPLASKERVDASMVKDTYFVTLAKGYTHQRIFEKWAKENKIDSSRIHYTNEIQTSNSMIASGMSAGMMIDLLVRDRTDIVQVPLENPPKFYVSLLIDNRSDLSAAQKRFNQSLFELSKSIFKKDS